EHPSRRHLRGRGPVRGERRGCLRRRRHRPAGGTGSRHPGLRLRLSRWTSQRQTSTQRNGGSMKAMTIVTGGASGLGSAIVDRLLAEGERPAVIDLKPPRQDVPYQAVDLADARAAEEAVRALA